MTACLAAILIVLLGVEARRRLTYTVRQHAYQQLLPHVQTLGFFLNMPNDIVHTLATEWTELRGLSMDRKVLLIRAGIHPAAAKSPQTRLLDDTALETLSTRLHG
jgi:hypothetical protein